MPINGDPLDFLDDSSQGLEGNQHTDLIRKLLYEIMRVKELIQYYNSIPNGGGRLGSSILTELVSEAYSSLVNYDPVLMRKYYELLQNCD